MKERINIFWFRRDLRLEDNAGLHYALKSGLPVLPIFVFDRHILDRLEDRTDRRVEFIHAALKAIQEALKNLGSGLKLFHGYPERAFTELLEKYHIEQVFTNHDYEPYARERDQRIAGLLKDAGIAFHTFKDQVIFDRNEVLKEGNKPYTVYTPYSKKWKQALTAFYMRPYLVRPYFGQFFKHAECALPSLESMGFKASGRPYPPPVLDDRLFRDYATLRDYPAEQGTSHLSVHLRFGTISIRKLVQQAVRLSSAYLNELIWREFYQMILWYFPELGKGRSFKPAYDHIEWRNNENEFERWCKGMTGYPIVDAGMRELNETGYMHNRVRMVTASFLSKHLLIDWRWGEAYFAEKLLDFDLAANNGNWQWVAGSGCDAAPYFRIFNPALQAKKFDSALVYIRKWIPELDSFDYPEPVIDHEVARTRCLKAYEKAVRGKVFE